MLPRRSTRQRVLDLGSPIALSASRRPFSRVDPNLPGNDKRRVASKRHKPRPNDNNLESRTETVDTITPVAPTPPPPASQALGPVPPTTTTKSTPLWRPTNMATEEEDVILPISPQLFRRRPTPSNSNSADKPSAPKPIPTDPSPLPSATTTPTLTHSRFDIEDDNEDEDDRAILPASTITAIYKTTSDTLTPVAATLTTTATTTTRPGEQPAQPVERRLLPTADPPRSSGSDLQPPTAVNGSVAKSDKTGKTEKPKPVAWADLPGQRRMNSKSVFADQEREAATKKNKRKRPQRARQVSRRPRNKETLLELSSESEKEEEVDRRQRGGGANRKPAVALSRTSGGYLSRVSLSSESSPEVFRRASLLPSVPLLTPDESLPAARNALATVDEAVQRRQRQKEKESKDKIRTYSKKKRRTSPNTTRATGVTVKNVSVVLPSTRALGITKSSPSRTPSTRSASTGGRTAAELADTQPEDELIESDQNDDDENYKDEDARGNAEHDDDDDDDDESDVGDVNDGSRTAKGRAKGSGGNDRLEAFYTAQRQLWKEVDEISLEEEDCWVQSIRDPLMSSSPCSLSFQTVVVTGRVHGPRQGRLMRQCVVLRELFPRHLLFRVVRSRDDKGKPVVTFGQPANGRSAYVSKPSDVVLQATRKNRIGRALRCRIPRQITQALEASAHEWDRVPNDAKGLLYCEAYGLDGVLLPSEQIQHCLPFGHDSAVFDAEEYDIANDVQTNDDTLPSSEAQGQERQ